MDVEAYLRRIQYDGPRDPSPATLRGLHRQHLFTVPFENLDIALGNPIVLDPGLLFDKIVVRKRGGFCYELNGLFHDLLSALGFRVEMLSARVGRADGSFSPEFDHMLLKVTLDDPWLADVGFGDSFMSPLLLQPEATELVEGNSRFRVAALNGAWDVLRRDEESMPVTLYRFTEVASRVERVCSDVSLPSNLARFTFHPKPRVLESLAGRTSHDLRKAPDYDQECRAPRERPQQQGRAARMPATAIRNRIRRQHRLVSAYRLGP